MKKTFKKSQLIGAMSTFAAAFLLLPPTKAVVAYLPAVGAPALRFGVVTTNDFNYSRFEMELAAGPKPVSVTPGKAHPMAETTLETNNPAATSPPEISNANMSENRTETTATSQENAADEEKATPAGGNFNFPTSTASDLLTVTPQMIAQYLKPDPSGTNALDRPGAVVFVPADMSFTPPAPRSGGESRASYHSQ